MLSKRPYNWKHPQACTSRLEIVRRLFQIIDEQKLNRGDVFNKAGYNEVSASHYAHDTRRMHVATLIDVAQSLGYKLDLVKI